MNESYAEAGCKRKNTPSSYLIRIGLILLAALFFLVSLQNQLLLLLATAVVVVIVYFFPRFNVEYEYIFCDGQIDFDKISGGQKRKTQLRIDFEQVEICAPVKSHALDGYTYQKLKVKDFTSGEINENTYAVIVRDKGDILKVLFEPNENMLDCIKQKSPRKLVRE